MKCLLTGPGSSLADTVGLARETPMSSNRAETWVHAIAQ